MNTAEEFYTRAFTALRTLETQPALRDAIAAHVDGFFKRFPNLQRTEITAGYIASLALERLSTAADSQSAGVTNAETKKVA